MEPFAQDRERLVALKGLRRMAGSAIAFQVAVVVRQRTCVEELRRCPLLREINRGDSRSDHDHADPEARPPPRGAGVTIIDLVLVPFRDLLRRSALFVHGAAGSIVKQRHEGMPGRHDQEQE